MSLSLNAASSSTTASSTTVSASTNSTYKQRSQVCELFNTLYHANEKAKSLYEIAITRALDDKKMSWQQTYGGRTEVITQDVPEDDLTRMQWYFDQIATLSLDVDKNLDDLKKRLQWCVDVLHYNVWKEIESALKEPTDEKKKN